MKQIRQLLALFLCLCLFVGAAVPAMAEAKAIDDPDDFSGYDDFNDYDLRSNFVVEEVLAEELHALGLLNGVGTYSDGSINYALDRAPTRVEALVLYLRAIGAEREALRQNWEHPFTDVPKWADNYVGYAYQMGYTKGIKDDETGHLFGTGTASASMYLTFMLRALGYTDSGEDPDFSWRDPFVLADLAGLLPYQVVTDDFLRADAISVSYAALSSWMNGEAGQTLADRLIEKDVFTAQKYAEVTGVGRETERRVLDAEEIYAKCSGAVFYIEVYDEEFDLIKTGSGFFVGRNGLAITNYHVISGGAFLYAATPDEEWYQIAGVYDYDAEEDWAVIQVRGAGFDCLTVDDSEPVGGATVYTIGSPLGLQNTIAQGIISNPARWDEGVKFIQTSAAISHGSSGGALINKYGEVIGITSATYEEGQNLNLALPMEYVPWYWTYSDLMTFEEVNAATEIYGYLTLSEDEIFLENVGDTFRLLCTADVYGEVTYYLEYYIYSEDVADAEWDEDWDGDSIGLTLEGLSKGASQVIVWLYGNDQLLDSQTFMVYVATAE